LEVGHGGKKPHPARSNFVQKPHNQPRINGTYGKRTKQRIRNSDIMMGTWNVRTILQPGKMQEVAQKMIRYQTGIMALQEMRWQGSGRADKPQFIIIYSGSQKRTGQLGTGFMTARMRKESLLEYETINDNMSVDNKREILKCQNNISTCPNGRKRKGGRRVL
jgi:hypothetical protein